MLLGTVMIYEVLEEEYIYPSGTRKPLSLDKIRGMSEQDGRCIMSANKRSILLLPVYTKTLP